MNIFFDVGTNLFQGYTELKSRLGISDSWVKVFVEPNPNFPIEQVQSIPNSIFMPVAISDDLVDEYVNFYITKDQDVLSRDRNMDQGAGIYNNNNKTCLKVKRLSILDLVKTFENIENWYFKFDCEGAEFASIPLLIEKYNSKIRFIACEFHHRGLADEPQKESIRRSIIENCQKYNIEFLEWH